ncbi:glycoside hydrolase family 95 protein [Chitinophaga nivalis]|uniref:Glycoside hydrolase family 95 protein n=1 Tax=Chitinophaga nivalis TaxID=2991709 RepID=A0ABT3ITD3_9BACT|nr:glycoside hydrolase family 95 protein [Chitinophaga nivalis]MCW3463068.1 glycoside hydrolase family 95 protein [Chitinophaga nivalis]MCW3487242.1 glycoside hydrolase family 95 protein [Chitinophaga nivalis]
MKYCLLFLLLAGPWAYAQPAPQHNLHFSTLAAVWDEGIPLGNGTLGALIWQKGDHLRFSLDRSNLWDLRPMKGLNRPEFRYDWVAQQVQQNNYALVQQYFDAPYEAQPAPCKIPGGALEFDTRLWGAATDVQLNIATAECRVQWKNGVTLRTFVHATQPTGWFRFENIAPDFVPQLRAPQYTGNKDQAAGGSIAGDDLARLGYTQGTINVHGQTILYRQPGWNGFTYEIAVTWKRPGPGILEGTWSISAHYPRQPATPAANVVRSASATTYANAYTQHTHWWQQYWSKSALQLPDSTIEKQWYLEQYKFGSVARSHTPVITLQAVWTADNGRLPPWKGDVHNDLNTQLSYWPAYTANHLEEAASFTNWLGKTKAAGEKYTRQYFTAAGLNVPGVQTLDGQAMGGWIQYACSPTISAWLSQHFYWQWSYSMDTAFLRRQAYPWAKATAQFLESVTRPQANGKRQLPISSSPEFNDNDISAWSYQNTNYDLSLMKYAFRTAQEMATALSLPQEAAHWQTLEAALPPLALGTDQSLQIKENTPYTTSHRHFSHLMSIYPLGLLHWENGAADQAIIRRSLQVLDSIGPQGWCGYSYSWLANLKARARDGEGAARALQTFAKAFCLPNSFHANGDQTKSGYSGFTYRPFTLEGNFAFAAGVQEMLLQSYAGYIHVFPAVPDSWKEMNFRDLRTQGAFLVSAGRTGGQTDNITIRATQGGKARLLLPFHTWIISGEKGVISRKVKDGFMEISFRKGGHLTLHNGYE